MPQTELEPFIAAAKAKGAGDEFLASLLIRRGWSSTDIYSALANWWERAAGVPVPVRRASSEGARDAFLYLLAFSTLATWAGALGSLWFQLIEHWLPDPVFTPVYLDLRSVVTWQIASIFVALPVYLFVMRLILRESNANPERIESGVRKWLTYIALLLTATGLVCDLVCFVEYFLRGELSLRFTLKCLVVLVICGSIFWYYFGFLKGRIRSGWFAAFAVALASIAICFGMGFAGTPSRQRAIEADARRVQDLRMIARAVHQMPGPPKSLRELTASHPSVRIADPDTGQPYEYAVTGAGNYRLCANFATDGSESNPYGSVFWAHRAGRACFTLDASKQAPW